LRISAAAITGTRRFLAANRKSTLDDTAKFLLQGIAHPVQCQLRGIAGPWENPNRNLG
jgi:hypothetical protein